jgi:hypothetical protein
MAEQPGTTVVQNPPTSGAAPPPTDWDASLARLNETMREAEIAANAQRDLEANGIPTDEPAEDEPPAEQGDEAPLPDDQELEGADTTPADKAQEQPRPPEPKPEGEQKRYSRRDAARLDAELADTTRRLNELSTRAQQYEQTDRTIISRLADLTGADGRYEQLAQKVLDGSASTEEQQHVQQMHQWRQVAGPVYREAQREVWDAFSKDFSSLKELEGVSDPVYQELLKLPNPAQMLRKVYDLGVSAGEKRKASETTRLSAAVTDLRTKRATEKAQPVPATNGAPTNNGRLIDRMFKADGTLDPEYEKRAERGEFLGVDLTR